VEQILLLTATGWRGAADAQASMKPASMKPEDRERWRELATRKVLWELLDAAKKRVDVVTWRAEGGPEAEDFLDALESGRAHPLLRKWEEKKATAAANRPAPSLLDQSARRSVVLMCEALHRVGLSKTAARKRATKALQGVFPATIGQIRYWQDSYPLVVADEKRIASAINQFGTDHRHIAGWFAGLIRLAVDPLAARTARRILIER
jgi:hypothetical protein